MDKMVLKKTYIFGLLFAHLGTLVHSLNFDYYQEGSCRGRRYTVPEYFNTTWMETSSQLYQSAGSRYNMFRTASQSGDEDIPDYKVYYEGCIQVDINFARGYATAYSFGEKVGGYDLELVSRGVFNFIGPREYLDLRGTSRDTLIYTDNRSFAIFANCWLESDQRGWKVISNIGDLSPVTRKDIENQVASLGFDRKEFVFLNYDRCKTILTNPSTRRTRTTPRSKGTFYGRFDRRDKQYRE